MIYSLSKLKKVLMPNIGFKHSEETKRKIGRSGVNNGFLGKTHHPETRAIISQRLKEVMGTPEHRAIMNCLRSVNRCFQILA